MQIFAEFDFTGVGETAVPVIDTVGFIGTGDIKHAVDIGWTECIGFLCQFFFESGFTQTRSTHHFVLFFDLGIKGELAADGGGGVGTAVEDVVVAERGFSRGHIDIRTAAACHVDAKFFKLFQVKIVIPEMGALTDARPALHHAEKPRIRSAMERKAEIRPVKNFAVQFFTDLQTGGFGGTIFKRQSDVAAVDAGEAVTVAVKEFGNNSALPFSFDRDFDRIRIFPDPFGIDGNLQQPARSGMIKTFSAPPQSAFIITDGEIIEVFAVHHRARQFDRNKVFTFFQLHIFGCFALCQREFIPQNGIDFNRLRLIGNQFELSAAVLYSDINGAHTAVNFGGIVDKSAQKRHLIFMIFPRNIRNIVIEERQKEVAAAVVFGFSRFNDLPRTDKNFSFTERGFRHQRSIARFGENFTVFDLVSEYRSRRQCSKGDTGKQCRSFNFFPTLHLAGRTLNFDDFFQISRQFFRSGEDQSGAIGNFAEDGGGDIFAQTAPDIAGNNDAVPIIFELLAQLPDAGSHIERNGVSAQRPHPGDEVGGKFHFKAAGKFDHIADAAIDRVDRQNPGNFTGGLLCKIKSFIPDLFAVEIQIEFGTFGGGIRAADAVGSHFEYTAGAADDRGFFGKEHAGFAIEYLGFINRSTIFFLIGKFDLKETFSIQCDRFYFRENDFAFFHRSGTYFERIFARSKYFTSESHGRRTFGIFPFQNKTSGGKLIDLVRDADLGKGRKVHGKIHCSSRFYGIDAEFALRRTEVGVVAPEIDLFHQFKRHDKCHTASIVSGTEPGSGDIAGGKFLDAARGKLHTVFAGDQPGVAFRENDPGIHPVAAFQRNDIVQRVFNGIIGTQNRAVRFEGVSLGDADIFKSAASAAAAELKLLQTGFILKHLAFVFHMMIEGLVAAAAVKTVGKRHAEITFFGHKMDIVAFGVFVIGISHTAVVAGVDGVEDVAVFQDVIYSVAVKTQFIFHVFLQFIQRIGGKSDLFHRNHAAVKAQVA